MKLFISLLCASVTLSTTALARLGETEAQSQTRYGAPDAALVGAREAPLLRGATEHTYHTGTWRIRQAFVNGVAVRVEYMKTKDAESGRLPTVEEVKAILEAEKARYIWRDEIKRHRRNPNDHPPHGRGLWERSDRATAKLQGPKIVIESKDASALEEKLAKESLTKRDQNATAKDPAKLPKF
jgi:hypothetical protein